MRSQSLRRKLRETEALRPVALGSALSSEEEAQPEEAAAAPAINLPSPGLPTLVIRF